MSKLKARCNQQSYQLQKGKKNLISILAEIYEEIPEAFLYHIEKEDHKHSA